MSFTGYVSILWDTEFLTTLLVLYFSHLLDIDYSEGKSDHVIVKTLFFLELRGEKIRYEMQS